MCGPLKMEAELDLRQLEYFMAAVEQRSLGRAADKLNISQPAISKAIRRLEQRLGVELLDRLPRGVSPTEYGKMLADHGHVIHRELARAQEGLSALKLGDAGRVSIGAGSSMRIRLVPEAILGLLNEHPDIEVDLISQLHDRLIPALKEGRIDIAVCQISNASLNPNLEVFPLYSDKICPTVRAGHPLLKKKHVTAVDCLDYGWILPAKEHFGRLLLEGCFLGLNLPEPNTVIENSSTLFAISMVQRSDLISWHPTQVYENSGDGEVGALDIPEITITRTVGTSIRRGCVLSPATKLLIENLIETSRNMVEEGIVSEIKAPTP